MDFAEADRRYDVLRQQYQAGTLTAEAFDAALRDLMVQDAQGRWWAKSRGTGRWHYHDQTTDAWIEATPPVAPPAGIRRGPVEVLGATPPGPVTSQPQQPAPAAQYPPGQPGMYPMTQPAQAPLGSTASILLYVASFFVPLVGIVAFFLLRSRAFPSDKNAAKVALVLGIVSLLISCCWIYYASRAGAAVVGGI